MWAWTKINDKKHEAPLPRHLRALGDRVVVAERVYGSWVVTLLRDDGNERLDLLIYDF